MFFFFQAFGSERLSWMLWFICNSKNIKFLWLSTLNPCIENSNVQHKEFMNDAPFVDNLIRANHLALKVERMWMLMTRGN
jgi:hypothetical protein